MLGIELQRKSSVSLSRQLYMEFVGRIADGRLKSGEALPSTRELAVELGVSRNTVCEAYEMLMAEEYIVSRQGAPTRVAHGIGPNIRSVIPGIGPGSPDVRNGRIETGNGVKNLGSGRPAEVDFHTGRPDLKAFPMQRWLKLMYRTSSLLKPEQWGYTDLEGFLPLREEIARWLLRSRGINAAPYEIFITAGTTHALHILSEILFEPPFEILAEDPCHLGMLRAMKIRGYSVVSRPVDEHGLMTSQLGSSMSRLIYVTPSHQFPLGGILPANRRSELIRYAARNNAYIIEDDYDSEFRYGGPPVAPLHTMDPGRVIYAGTFSKILFPGLRIGYIILPGELQDRWRYMRLHSDVQNPLFEQAALAEFMRSRQFDRHLGKMRKLYGQRRKILLDALKAEFGTVPQYWGDAAGLHLAVSFPGSIFNRRFERHCRLNGLIVQTADRHCINKGAHNDKLLLGYGHLEPEDIRKGTSLLRACIESWHGKN
ncbi:MAG TPA: PLP-dependent aminotransferase family protein [Clostridia bacterium]|nr:PLP-dependent aminotransferase family protein [Clostridia bacterium]